MDDYLDSVNTVEEGLDLIADVTTVHQQGGFDIRGWASNAPRVLAKLDTEKLAKKAIKLSFDKEAAT